ncbi:isochorismatase family protein [Allofranklinella schreckenbergeri]|uniref:Isochorismatase family protein n=1 Tax=Allofranklinella schreckenbergeri TaxID=1076744 RepID=A0A3M6QDU3_9BURK|nr:isochorismatase family protein [Allofranklinella schreckenbergeri]RMW99413.1 isochorismatase family protein [Allofranklinella schreckenbergeri]RMX01296.1 isochorismatase family protein [Allofranklinella schreckenbergeri]
MLMHAEDAQLVLVDYQTRLMPVIAQGEQALANAVLLGKLAALFDVPCWGTEQNPTRLGPNAPEVKALCRQTISKMHFGACAEPALVEALRPAPPAPSGNARSLPKHLQKPRVQAPVREQIVIAGCEAHVCLLQTALGLLEEEFEVWVVTDACSSRTERNRDAAFDRLAAAGAELVTTEMVAFEWCASAENPRFKEMLALVK